MSRLIELLQTFELGHWLIIAGGILMVLGALGLLIRRSRRTGSEVEDEVTPDASLNRVMSRTARRTAFRSPHG